MYATVSTVHIKAHCVAAFCQRWRTVIEPAINQLPELVDLYLLVNPATETLMVFSIYACEAEALAGQASDVYQELFGQSADLLQVETVTHTGYIIIST
ncbi:MAG: hypothetical protein DYG89_36135 [Caldilinea sp. CFX5]|nr:hypothetical protein [Caldilinea sp. CFX5]